MLTIFQTKNSKWTPQFELHKKYIKLLISILKIAVEDKKTNEKNSVSILSSVML